MIPKPIVRLNKSMGKTWTYEQTANLLLDRV